jgi:VanZ family protein
MMVRARWLALLAGFFLLMVGIGSVPGEANALSDRFGDKWLHTLAYGFMALLCFHALVARPLTRALLTMITIALLGLVDESIQSLLPYRNASVADWCCDVGSAATVVAILLFLDRITTPTEPHAKN